MFNWRKGKNVKDAFNDQVTLVNEELSENSDNNIELLKNNQERIVDKLSRKIEETGFAVEGLIDTISSIAKNVEIQMESVDKVAGEIGNYSALAEEVFANIAHSKETSIETLKIADDGNEAANNSINAMNEIQKSVEYVKEVVNTLSVKSLHINEMLKIIKDIADQTNLLSLNASIEAARAGDAGRGFAVVAAEVKKLAQRSAESAEKISITIHEINESINQTTKAMDTSGVKVKEGVSIANNTKEVFRSIIDAVNTSTDVTEEINRAISTQMESLEIIVESTDDMNNTSQRVMSMVESASMNTQYTKNSIESLFDKSKDLKTVTNDLLGKIDAATKNEYILKTYLGGIPDSFDPIMTFDSQSDRLLSNIHSGLLILGLSNDIMPGIAKSWYVEDDNVTWVFNLRKGAKFHNGNEVSSEDVKYSLERLLSPKFNSPNAWFLALVYGADEFKNGKTSEVKGIKVLDRYRISIKLSEPYSGFILNLAQKCCVILNKADAEREVFTGCGPYIVGDIGEDKYTLTAFKDYFGGCPYVDKIEITHKDETPMENFISGKYDFVSVEGRSSIDKIKNSQYSDRIILRSIMSTSYAGFNLKSNSIFAKDSAIRRAINYAINKERIINDLMGGYVVESKGPFPPSIIDNSYLEGFKHNPQKAKEIIRSKYPSGIKEKLVFLARESKTSTLNDKVTAYMIEDLKAIGIECEVAKVPSDKYSIPDNLDKCDVFMQGWIADTGDPDNYLEPLFNPDNYTNFTGYNNPEVLNLMNKARGIINPEKRIEMYKNIQGIIVEDCPWIFLYHQQSGVVSRNGVLGANLNSLGRIRYDEIMIEKQQTL